MKIAEFRTFLVVDPAEVPKGSKIFYPRWVDTLEKSRLTVADLKAKGAPPGWSIARHP